MNEGIKNTGIKKKKSRKIFRKIFLVLFLLFTGLVILVQTSYFKNRLLLYGVNKVNEILASKEGVLSVESIEGSILKDLKLNGIILVVKKDTLAKIQNIDLAYDLLGFFDKRIHVRNAVLSSPQINFYSVTDEKGERMWSLAYLLKSDKKEEDTIKSEFDWKITADNFEIRDGSIRMLWNKPEGIPVGSALISKIEHFNTDSLDVTKLNIKLNGSYLPDEKNINIEQIAFRTNSDFNINRLTFTASLNKDDLAKVRNLRLRTDRTKVYINLASLENLNPLKNNINYEEFEKKKFAIRLLADRFDFEDLTFFLPDIDFMGGKVYLDLEADGNYQDFSLGKLQARLEQGTYVNIDGMVKNLHDPSKLYLDVKGHDVVINPYDKDIHLAGLPIPDYRHLGTVYTDFTFKGEPQKFDAEIDVRSTAGNAHVKGFLDITQSELVYNGDIKTQNLNIGRILKEKSLESSITSELNVQGRGVDYKTLTGKVNYKINNTTFFDERISSSSGNITARSGDYELDVDYNSGTGSAKAAGNVNVRDIENIVYNLKGSCKNFDLSAITKEPKDKSDLNFAFDVNGSGTSPDGVNGDFKFDVAKSMFAEFLIPETPLHVKVQKTISSSGDVKSITLNSNFLDLELAGKFSFITLPGIIAANIKNITDEYSRRLNLDSTELLGGYTSWNIDSSVNRRRNTDSSYTNQRTFLSTDSSSLISRITELDNQTGIVRLSTRYSYNTEFRYKIKIKNLLPLFLISGDSSIVLKCDIKGRFADGEGRFIFNTSGTISDFSYHDSLLSFSKGIIMLDVRNEQKNIKQNSYVSGFDAVFSKIKAQGNYFDTVAVNFNTDASRPDVTVFAKKDTVLGFYTEGFLSFGRQYVGVRLDTIFLKLNNYSLVNKEPLKVSYEVAGLLKSSAAELFSDTGKKQRNINFENFVLGDANQGLQVTGFYSIDGESDLNLLLNRVNLAKIQILANPMTEKQDLIKGNIRRLNLHFLGTPENPKIYTEVNTDVLSMQKMKLGRIDALVDYADNKILPRISFYNQNNEGILTVNGYVPFQNPLIKTDSTITAINFLEGDVNLKIDSKDYQIKILEQFIPVISQLNGKMNGSIDVAGKVAKPLLTGSLNINKGSFIFDMTGARYSFDADIATDAQKLNFQKFVIYQPSDKMRRMNMSGYIDFSNLSINDIELKLDGSAKLIDEKVAQNIIGIYGQLYGHTGANPILLKGNPSGMIMTGDLLVTQGRINIIPNLKNAYDIYADDFRYKVLLDTASIGKDSINIFKKRFTDSLSVFEKNRLDPFDALFQKNQDSAQTAVKSNFRYNINFRTLQNIYARMLIEEKTKQEFYGNVSANITFDNFYTGTLKTRGRVELAENCYYKFYKAFSASGYINFTDTISNPELNILGIYQSNATDPNNSGQTREVEIKLLVTGHASNPKLIWQVTSGGSAVGGYDQTDEAISFIVFGRFKDELGAGQQLNLFSNVGANVGVNMVSGLLSNVVNSYIPWIVKTDISYKEGGNLAQNADIRVTAELAGATVMLGGQILQDLSNTNFLIEYPLNKVFGMTGFSQNLILQFERYVDPFSQNNVFSTNNRTGGGLYYRIKF